MENTRSKKILYGACAVAFGAAVCGASLPFGAYPFEFALLCAVGAWAPLAYVGIFVGTLIFKKNALLLVAYTLLLVGRAAVSLLGKKELTVGGVGAYIFRESAFARALEAAAACLCVGIFRMWRGGFLYYDLIAMIASMLASASLVALWSGLGRAERKGGLVYGIALLSVSAAAVWSLRGVGGYGVELSTLLCAALTLLATKQRGVIFGCFEGLLCGLCVSVSYAPMFVFSSVCFAFFGSLSSFVGVVLALGAALAWGYYLSGVSALAVLLPSLLAGDLIYYIFEKIYLTRKVEAQSADAEEEAESGTESETESETDKLFLSLREGLATLASESETHALDMRDISDYIDKIYRARTPQEQGRILELSIAGRARRAHGEKKFCGDSYGSFEAEDGMRTAVLISDGMGSGKEAARVSSLCQRFVQRLFLLSVHSEGFFESATQMLNSFLRIENGARECSCTLDLADFDLRENIATFYKCGSAPTYVFRDGAIFKLRAETVPLGIFDEADIGKTQMDILPGDVFVMMSDGVSDIGDKDGALAEILSRALLTHSAEQLAAAVIEYSNGQGAKDDVSTVVIKVSERNVFERAG